MNMFFNKIVALFMTFLSFLPWNTLNAKKNAEDFRIVTYVAGDVIGGISDPSDIDASHFSQVTDVIFIGMSDIDTEGNIVLDDDFETTLANLRTAIGDNDVNLHLNLIAVGDGTAGENHTKAFESGVLEQNILAVLQKYDFDGVFFDYEYPQTEEQWAAYDKFLISLDGVLGDDYKIGAAVSAWNNEQSKDAIKVIDMAEVMAYDIWDDDGTHSSIELTKCCVMQMLLDGYSKSQMDLGIPFYARPTGGEAYWYGYNSYEDAIDEEGFMKDPETGLTFSFNTYDTVYDKTEWAIRFGLGGVMSWHYSCDTPASDPKSLFNAEYNAKTDMMK